MGSQRPSVRTLKASSAEDAGFGVLSLLEIIASDFANLQARDRVAPVGDPLRGNRGVSTRPAAPAGFLAPVAVQPQQK